MINEVITKNGFERKKEPAPMARDAPFSALPIFVYNVIA